MQTVDFLPDSYRERFAQRRNKLWQLIVVSLFGSLIAAAAVGQHWLHRSLVTQVSVLDFEFTVARANQEVLDRTKAHLKEAQAAARLYTYLACRWPRTRLLAAIAGPLPEAVTLSELKLSGASEVAAPSQGNKETSEQADSSQDPPATADLKQFQALDAAGGLVLVLKGFTADAADLHQYVLELGQIDLFRKAELVSLESSATDPADSQFEFTIRVLIRPCRAEAAPPAKGAAKQLATKTPSSWSTQ